ncbi:hypothetical protein [Herpetosiphon llansteffanensis]|nr:hypothetical protein [Herpetosiphon llansteffanensis]
MAEAEQAIKLINGNGLIGILIVLLFFLSRSAVASKIWDWFVSWFNPERADAKQKAKQDAQERESRLRREELELLSHVYDGELLDAYKKNTEVNTQAVMTMQAIQIELRASRQDLDDMKLDIAGIYAYIRQPQLSRERRNPTQPNQSLPTNQEGKPNARNHQRNR